MRSRLHRKFGGAAAVAGLLAMTAACATAKRPDGGEANGPAKVAVEVVVPYSSATVTPAALQAFRERLVSALGKGGFDPEMREPSRETPEKGLLLRVRVLELPRLGDNPGFGRVVVAAALHRDGTLLLDRTYEEQAYFGVNGHGDYYSGDQPQFRAMNLAVRAIARDAERAAR